VLDEVGVARTRPPLPIDRKKAVSHRERAAELETEITKWMSGEDWGKRPTGSPILGIFRILSAGRLWLFGVVRAALRDRKCLNDHEDGFFNRLIFVW
jgi:hypothetical protein